MKTKIPPFNFSVVAVIFLIGLFLRLVELQTTPPGFNADEAALGYNAFSILKTGKDEWGINNPFVLKSFSDYKPALYVYLDIPFIAAFGLTELAVRLPSILLGSFSIILIYFLSKELFKKEIIAVASAFLLAISPWHLQYSRGAWETNIATFFILLGIFSLVKGLKNYLWLFIAVLAFIAAMYSYQSPRLIVPLLLIPVVVLNWHVLFVKKNVIIAILAVILLLPLLFLVTNNTGLARFQGVSIFSDIGPLNRVNQERGEDSNPNSLMAKFYHNKFLSFGENFLNNYLEHFTPSFLFLDGDPLKRNKVPGMGQLYLFEIVTLLIGVYSLIKRKYDNVKIIVFWLITAPIAAALTYQTPHALRAESMVIPLTLISGLGLGIIIEKIWKLQIILRYLFMTIFLLIISFFITDYFHNYYVHLPKEYALEWEYGFSKMAAYVLANQNKYEKIITDRYDQAYILLLFYSKYDPAKYQQMNKQIGDNKFGFTTISSFDKYEFKNIAKEEIDVSKKTLFIGTKEEIDQDRIPLEVINFPDGTPVFKIIGT